MYISSLGFRRPDLFTSSKFTVSTRLPECSSLTHKCHIIPKWLATLNTKHATHSSHVCVSLTAFPQPKTFHTLAFECNTYLKS